MVGAPIQAVNEGLQTLQLALRRNPQASETVHVSVITFGGDVRVEVPLTDVVSFSPPLLRENGSTPFGEALQLVTELAKKDVQIGQKRDWKPMVFIMTDGAPDPGYESAITEFKKYSWGPVIAFGVGDADINVLKKVTERVCSLDTMDPAQMADMFKWLSTATVKMSQKIDTVGGAAVEDELEELPVGISFV